MASKLSARQSSVIAIVLLVVLFFAVNIFADIALRGVRVDLTENNLYTLSPGTRNILRDLDEPIRLTLFYSESAAMGRPQLQAYARRITELLDEYELIAGDSLEVEVLDPEPFSEAEERAQREGVAAVPAGGGEQFYLGLVGTNSTDGRELIRFFDPSEERFLEYEITRLVYKLANPVRPTIGVLSSLAIDGGPPNPMSPEQSARPWQIMRELRGMFDVEMLPPTTTEIAGEIDLLLVVHPKNFPEPLRRAIDQFVIGGGRTIICLDPLCEADVPPDAAQNPMAVLNADRSSNLPDLLGAWGLRMPEDEVATDLENAMRGRSRDGRSVVPYIQYIGLGPAQLNDEDAITGELSLLQIVAGGSLVHDTASGTNWTPLVSTSSESMLVESSKLSFFADPQELVAEFVPRDRPITIAGRLGGTATSAFSVDTDQAEEGSTGSERSAAAQSGEINVIIIADVDFLSDRWWVDEVRMGNITLGYQKLSDNADLLINALDHLSGSNDLISLRARGAFARPFTLVNEIRQQAEKKYLSEAQALEEKRQEASRRLSELQRARPDSGELILSPEQEAELQKFRDQLAETNAQLRDVRYNLRKDVEQLGLTLKIVNTAAAPALVALFAVGLGVYRAMHRKADRRTMAGQG